MNRSVVKVLVWIDGRGVVLALRSAQAREQAGDPWYVQLVVSLRKWKLKFNKQEPVS